MARFSDGIRYDTSAFSSVAWGSPTVTPNFRPVCHTKPPESIPTASVVWFRGTASSTFPLLAASGHSFIAATRWPSGWDGASCW